MSDNKEPAYFIVPSDRLGKLTSALRWLNTCFAVEGLPILCLRQVLSADTHVGQSEIAFHSDAGPIDQQTGEAILGALNRMADGEQPVSGLPTYPMMN